MDGISAIMDSTFSTPQPIRMQMFTQGKAPIADVSGAEIGVKIPNKPPVGKAIPALVPYPITSKV